VKLNSINKFSKIQRSFMVTKIYHFFVSYGFTLQQAAYYGHTEVVKLLLEQGADVHAENDYALRWAAINGHTKVVKLLLEQGADVHVRDDLALRCAAEYGHTEVVKLLEKYMNNIKT